MFALLFPAVLGGLVVEGVAHTDTPADRPASAVTPPVGDAVDARTANEPPLAEAGLDREVVQGVAVALDAGGSRDPDGEVVAYTWTITAPNGSTFAPECPDCKRTTFTPTRVGRYEVQITVEDDDGATDTDTLYVDVGAADPPAVAVTGPTSVTTDDTPQYTASVSPGDVPVSRVVWSADGREIADRTVTDAGATDLRFDPDSPGTVRLTATVVDVAGNEAADTVEVQVSRPDDGVDAPGDETPTPTASPTARFQLNRTTVCADDSVEADPGGSTGGGPVDGERSDITTTAWRVDGQAMATDDGTPVRTLRLSDPGTRTVTLQVRDAAGRTDDTTRTVTVRPSDDDPCVTDQSPVAVIDAPDSVSEDTRVTLDGSESFDRDGSGPRGSEIESYEWTVDGTTVGEGETISYVVNSDTEIELTVADDDGSSDTAVKQVNVDETNGPPSVSISGPSDLSVDESGTWSVSASDSDGYVTDYDWNIGSGSSASTSWSSKGTYTVRVTVTDDDGATTTATKQVSVRENSPPAVGISGPSNLDAGETGTWDVSHYDTDGYIDSVDWNIGGGWYNASNSWSSEGTYTVKVTVTDNDGATRTATKTVSVSEPEQSDGDSGGNGDSASPAEVDEVGVIGPDVLIGSDADWNQGIGNAWRFCAATTPGFSVDESGSCPVPGAYDAKIKVRYQKSPGEWASFTTSAAQQRLSFNLDSDPAGTITDTRRVTVTLLTHKGEDELIQATDTVRFCKEPEDVPQDELSSYPQDCKTSADIPNILIQQRSEPSDPVETGSTITLEADLKNRGLYDDWSVEWNAPSAALDDSTGLSYSTEASNGRPYVQGREVTAEASASIVNGKTSTDSMTFKYEVCPSDEEPDGEGSCETVANDEESEGSTGGKSGDEGSDDDSDDGDGGRSKIGSGDGGDDDDSDSDDSDSSSSDDDEDNSDGDGGGGHARYP